MNIEEYISSGVLELYAAGALSAAEAAEVEQYARQYPEVQAELNQITNTLDRYAEMHAITPPAHLKDKVLQAVARNSATRTTEPDSAGRIIDDTEPTARIIPMGRPNQSAASNLLKWVVAASLLLLLLSNALSFYFYRNWKNADQNLQLALATQQQYAQNFERVQQKLSLNQKALAVMSDGNTRRVELKGVDKSPESRVTVYWHPLTKDVYLNVENLPTPPTDKQYQLWALLDGKPIDAGVITGQDIAAEFHHMKEVQNAQAFAITLEPRGGSISPTLEEMYVMGKI